MHGHTESPKTVCLWDHSTGGRSIQIQQ